MSHREDVLRQAMALPAENRAYVVAILKRSLSSGAKDLTGDMEIAATGISGEALLIELDRRSAVYRLGATTARPAADMLADLKARQATPSRREADGVQNEQHQKPQASQSFALLACASG